MLRDASQQADTGPAAVASGAFQPGKYDVLAPSNDTQQQQDAAAEPAEAPMPPSPVDPGCRDSGGLVSSRLDDAVVQATLLVPASC
jgi:hypothetical protein